MNASITVTKNQAATLTFAFTDASGDDYDLTGCTVTLTVRKAAASTAIFSRTAALSANVATFDLTSTDTDQDVRAYQATLDLLAANGTDTESRIFYFVVTNRTVSQSTTTVSVGTNQANGSVTVQQPSNDTDKYYRLDFAPSTTVNVPHNLGKRPSVTVVDSAGDIVECDVQYIDDNNITLAIAAVFSGSVFCN